MANQPRDWDKELAKIDRLISAQAGAPKQPASRERAPAAPPAQGKPAAPALPSADRGPRWAVWGRVVLGVVLGAAVTQWPNAHACGVALFLYLGAVGMVLLAGGWGAVTAWRRRLPGPHVASLALMLWGLALGAREVLPRVGYAQHSSTWICQ